MCARNLHEHVPRNKYRRSDLFFFLLPVGKSNCLSDQKPATAFFPADGKPQSARCLPIPLLPIVWSAGQLYRKCFGTNKKPRPHAFFQIVRRGNRLLNNSCPTFYFPAQPGNPNKNRGKIHRANKPSAATHAGRLPNRAPLWLSRNKKSAQWVFHRPPPIYSARNAKWNRSEERRVGKEC